MTWEKNEKLIRGNELHPRTRERHAKFANYEFNVEEFMKLVSKAVEKIKNNPDFIEAKRKKYAKDEF